MILLLLGVFVNLIANKIIGVAIDNKHAIAFSHGKKLKFLLIEPDFDFLDRALMIEQLIIVEIIGLSLMGGVIILAVMNVPIDPNIAISHAQTHKPLLRVEGKTKVSDGIGIDKFHVWLDG